jgi:hypothetical protein
LEENVWAVCVVENAKTRRAFGFKQFALVNDANFAAWTQWFFENAPCPEKFFHGDSAALTTIFRSMLELLGVPSTLFSLSSFRAGGATHAYRVAPEALPTLQFQGRWVAQKTMNHYVQSAMVELMGAMVPPAARIGVESFANYFSKLQCP